MRRVRAGEDELAPRRGRALRGTLVQTDRLAAEDDLVGQVCAAQRVGAAVGLREGEHAEIRILCEQARGECLHIVRQAAREEIRLFLRVVQARAVGMR